MEDFECPPQDDVPAVFNEPAPLSEAVATYRRELLLNARAVMPGILAGYVAYPGMVRDEAGPEESKRDAVRAAFVYAKMMMDEADKSAEAFQPMERKVPV